MPFKFREDISIADVAFEATGKTLEELFESCAAAIAATMVKNYKKIASKVKRKFSTPSTDSIEKLLHDFMNELIFIKDADQIILKECKLKISVVEGHYDLTAECFGDEIDAKKYTMLVDVKAATWHMFKVEQTKRGWKAFVILDV